MQHHTGNGSRDVDHGLVRLHLHEGLVHLDSLAHVDVPVDYHGLGEALADVGKMELVGHVSGPQRAVDSGDDPLLGRHEVLLGLAQGDDDVPSRHALDGGKK